MSLYYRKRIRVGRRSTVNLSKTGASVSTRVGPVTVNSGGRVSVRLGHGLTWRVRR